MKSQEKIVGIVLIAVAFLTLGEAVRLTSIYPMTHHVGPSTFPFLVGTGILAAGLYFLFSKNPRHTDRSVSLPEGRTGRKMIHTMAVMVGYSIGMPLLGYPLSTLVSSILLFRVIGDYSFRFSVIGGLLVTVVLYLTFSELVYIPFPKGILWGLS
jgi:putative tricarboxylic transport membrane protein